MYLGISNSSFGFNTEEDKYKGKYIRLLTEILVPTTFATRGAASDVITSTFRSDYVSPDGNAAINTTVETERSDWAHKDWNERVGEGLNRYDLCRIDQKNNTNFPRPSIQLVLTADRISVPTRVAFVSSNTDDKATGIISNDDAVEAIRTETTINYSDLIEIHDGNPYLTTSR